jgi:hypothetical protein
MAIVAQTKRERERTVAAFKAWKEEGRQARIQFQTERGREWVDWDKAGCQPIWSMDVLYRVNPEPAIRPWDEDRVGLHWRAGRIFREKCTGDEHRPTGFAGGSLLLNGSWYSAGGLLKFWDLMSACQDVEPMPCGHEGGEA